MTEVGPLYSVYGAPSDKPYLTLLGTMAFDKSGLLKQVTIPELACNAYDARWSSFDGMSYTEHHNPTFTAISEMLME